MGEVNRWSLFAYMNGDDGGVHDERRELAEWQLEDVVRWCVFRGYDNIYLARSDETTRFEKRPPPENVRHHFE